MIGDTDERSNKRVENELAHGKILADGGLPEYIWGWTGPAGSLRAHRRANLIIQNVGLRPRQTALEIGCGSGLFTEMFAKSGANITGVELSPQLANLARERVQNFKNVTIINNRFEDYLDGGEFDAIVAVSVLHHLVVETAIRIAFEKLKPGGKICFSEPNMLNPQIFFERKLKRIFPNVIKNTTPNEIAFLRGKLAQSLKEVGFSEITITPFDWLHPATPKPLISLASKLGCILELIPGAREFAGSLLITATKPVK